MFVTIAEKIVMIFTLGLLFVTMTSSAQGSPRSELKQMMLKLQPAMDWKTVQNLSGALLQLPVEDRELAIAIAFQECSLLPKSSVCQSSVDKGLFQFSPSTIRELRMNPRLLNGRNLKYEVRHYKKWMAVKKKMCKKKYYHTWFACWNSASFKNHYRYATYIFKHLNKLRK